MEHESVESKIVMDGGADTEVLARVASLDIASAAYMAAIAKYPHRNVYLRQARASSSRTSVSRSRSCRPIPTREAGQPI
jgi:hypothetical protein